MPVSDNRASASASIHRGQSATAGLTDAIVAGDGGAIVAVAEAQAFDGPAAGWVEVTAMERLLDAPSGGAIMRQPHGELVRIRLRGRSQAADPKNLIWVMPAQG